MAKDEAPLNNHILGLSRHIGAVKNEIGKLCCSLGGFQIIDPLVGESN